MEMILDFLTAFSKAEITFRGSFAFFAAISVIYTFYRMLKKIIQGIKLDRKEKMAQEKN